MKITTYLLGLALTGMAVFCGEAQAAPVQWTIASGGNGHYYDFLRGAGSGNIAVQDRALALASTYMGMSGYLATVTSAAENNFISTMVDAGTGYIGGSEIDQTGTYQRGTWQWQDGPEASGVFYSASGAPLDYSYSNWIPGQPDGNPFRNEPYAVTNVNTLGGWAGNDGTAVFNYFVEYSAAPIAAVPEPASWALMIGGFGLTSGMMRRRVSKVNYAAA